MRKTDKIAAPTAAERLAEAENELSDLEETRKELLREVAKKEAAEEVQDNLKEAESARETAEEESAERGGQLEEARQALRQFGGHGQECLSGALLGQKAAHPLCTCGWNDVATEIERW